VEEIRASLAADHRPSFRDLIVPGTHRLRPVLWIGLMLATFQQFVGINVVFYYGSVLWQSAGFTEGDALLINVISGAVSIAACVVAILVIDKLGRKPMLVIGSVGMTLTLGTMAYFFGTAAVGDHANLTLGPVAGPAALVAANLYVIFFNFSWGPVMWVMLGEMFPNQFRGSALAICGLAQWLANFAITMSFPLLLAGLGLGGAYGLYTLSALASIFLVLWLVRETKGRELEQMES
jgi:SP family sugar:H+ symporter-like MFS transporter